MMQEQGSNWMWGFGLGHSIIGLLVLLLLALGVAALIKYLMHKSM